jgi:hypothetical protein
LADECGNLNTPIDNKLELKIHTNEPKDVELIKDMDTYAFPIFESVQIHKLCNESLSEVNHFLIHNFGYQLRLCLNWNGNPID